MHSLRLLFCSSASCGSPTKTRHRISGVLLIVLLAFLPGILSAEQAVTMPQVPVAVQNGTAHLIGHADPRQMLRLVFALRPPHVDQEEQFLRELQDPDSPRFHQYLSEAEWNARFAPSAEDEQAVVAWAQSQGLTLTQRYANRLLVDVEGPVAVIEKALAVNINLYQMEDQTHFSNDRDPSIPAALANRVRAVLGLNNIEVAHKHLKGARKTVYPAYSPGPAYALGEHLQGDAQVSLADAKLKKGPSQFESFGSYDPTDLYSSYAYNYDALKDLGHCCNPLNHSGGAPPESSIAIVIWDDFSTDDLAGFLAMYPYLAHNVQKHFVNGTPHCCGDETTLDVEWSTAMSNSFTTASQTAAIHVYIGANASGATLLDAANHVLSDGLARVLSMSFGGAEIYDFPESTISSFHDIFDQMSGEGWSITAASGDGGATDDCADHLSVDYPGTDPNVTSVGGTSINTSQSRFGGEVAWTGGPYGCSENDGGSGGGCSTYFGAPGYQGSAACSNGRRSVPDIALNADWVHSPQNFYFEGQWYQSGGTSIASPEMAGFYAQENAYLLYIQSLVGHTCGSSYSAACAPLGNGNPVFYKEGLSPFAPHFPFYDITSGCNNNDITQQYHLSAFCAGHGYDRVTGWGSANMLQLAWTINSFLAGDSAGPSIAISGPPTNHWYGVDQTISWILTDASGNRHRPNGPSGASLRWDADPGDPTRITTPGAGSSYYGPQVDGEDGSAGGLANLAQGCHTAYVRAWDNAGNSAVTHYGPLCLDNVPPDTNAVLSGTLLQDGNYNGPALVTLVASDNASGVAGTYYVIDSGVFQPYSGPFYVYTPGSHQVTVYSVDYAGNVEQYHFLLLDIEQNQNFSLTLARPGTGTGTVTSSDGGINCGSTCSAGYWDGQPVSLTATPAQGSVFIGWRNCDLSSGLSCTVTVTAARTVSAIFNVPVALQLVPVPPCRVVDTRNANGPFGGPSLQAGGERDFAIPGGPCPGIPSNAAAYSLNVTAAPHGWLNYLTAWPTGLTQPVISLLNSDGRVKANAAIVPAGDNESVSVYATDATDVIIDIDGYFVPASTSTLAFFPLEPCRVVDTRNPNGPLGGPILTAGGTRRLPVRQSSCNIPSSAQAYSFNYTVVPHNGRPLGYLTTWPAGQSQPVVSTLNASTGAVTANAAIVPAGTGGDINVYPYGNDTDLIIDVNGYFAPASSGQQPLSLYTFASCRALDTRLNGGQPFSNELTINIVSSACEVPAAAQGYVLNATVVPSGSLNFLTLWPDGQNQPLASTLNAYDGAVTSNLAILPTNNGSIDAWADGSTQLILDISSYFAP